MKIVIIDNEAFWLRRMNNEVKKIINSDNLEVSIHKFQKYNEEFKKILYDGTAKIYIIDMELNDDIDGYDIVHEIRDIIFDWKSIIILASIHDERINIISLRLSILTYVSKNKNFDKNLGESVRLAINILGNYRFIKIKEHNQIYKLAINDIVKITKEKFTKYCIIETINNNEFRVRTSLLEINKELNFERINNYTLVNPNQINRLKLGNKR